MADQPPLFDVAFRPRAGAPVEALPLYDGRPQPCQGDGCGVVGAIYARHTYDPDPRGIGGRDLCLACTIATVRRMRAEGRYVHESYGWVV